MPATAIRRNLGSAFQIPIGEGREFEVDGVRVAVFRSRTHGLFATQALCPHREGPLADGLLGGSVLICPMHAWRFDLANGEALSGECGIRTFPIELDDNGDLILSLE